MQSAEAPTRLVSIVFKALGSRNFRPALGHGMVVLSLEHNLHAPSMVITIYIDLLYPTPTVFVADYAPLHYGGRHQDSLALDGRMGWHHRLARTSRLVTRPMGAPVTDLSRILLLCPRETGDDRRVAKLP